MNFFLTASLIISLIFSHSSNPAMIMILILSQTLVVCLCVMMTLKTSWFSYIMFLIFVGGLMVLFVYIVSLASNEMFNPKVKLMPLTNTFATVFLVIVVQLNNQNWTNTNNNSINENIFLIFSNSMLLITVSTMIYLLFTLVVVVKMASKYEGPLRSLIFNK